MLTNLRTAPAQDATARDIEQNMALDSEVPEEPDETYEKPELDESQEPQLQPQPQEASSGVVTEFVEPVEEVLEPDNVEPQAKADGVSPSSPGGDPVCKTPLLPDDAGPAEAEAETMTQLTQLHQPQIDSVHCGSAASPTPEKEETVLAHDADDDDDDHHHDDDTKDQRPVTKDKASLVALTCNQTNKGIDVARCGALGTGAICILFIVITLVLVSCMCMCIRFTTHLNLTSDNDNPDP